MSGYENMAGFRPGPGPGPDMISGATLADTRKTYTYTHVVDALLVS